MKVSVIMASYLKPYPGSTSNPEQKFIRAVKSFLTQTYVDKELIIVSDGCDVTERLYEFNFKKYNNIKFIKIQKGNLYSGDSRNKGIEISDGNIISYLDSDDVIGKKHLEIIMEQIDEYDLVYYDDYMVLDKSFKKLHKRNVEPRYGSIGTSSITHKRNDIKWQDGYGHDYIFLSSMIINGYKFKKIKPPQYLVCHYKDGDF